MVKLPMHAVFDFKKFLSSITSRPGVYRMYNEVGDVIYVGKANNLKKRLSTYICIKNKKVEAIVNNISNIDVTVTNTETEALLLEHNYIKNYKPKYNVLFRDDKSYPYIFLSNDIHPRLSISYSNNLFKNGEYFGPFPNIYAVRNTLKSLQKILPIRQCKNNIYQNRSRPCLQYQINRCLGPCIKGLVSMNKYIQYTNYVRLFLNGKNDYVISQLVTRMEESSVKLNFEEAIRLRDQIQSIRLLSEKQLIFKKNQNIDIISFAYNAGIACFHVLFVRHGTLIGSHSFFSNVPNNTELTELIQKFIEQFYLTNKLHTLPSDILLDFNLHNYKLLSNLLSELIGHKINIKNKPRGDYAQYLKLARTNANTALITRLSQYTKIQQRFIALESFLEVENNSIKRIEGFDISHIMGEQTVASCVAFNRSGPIYSDYRKYNIKDIPLGDDCAAINQVLLHHYGDILDNHKIPEIVLIDGGKAQLSQAQKFFSKLRVNCNKKTPILIAVAKGNRRKNGLEKIFLKNQYKGVSLPPDSPVLHIIQQIRDEAHKNAIISHRKKFAKAKSTSTLENIKGIGPKRRQQLLKYMGGLHLLKHANIDEITKIPGISFSMAKKIYQSFNS